MFIQRSSGGKQYILKVNRELSWPYLVFIRIPILGWWIVWEWQLKKNRGIWYRLAERIFTVEF